MSWIGGGGGGDFPYVHHKIGVVNKETPATLKHMGNVAIDTEIYALFNYCQYIL